METSSQLKEAVLRQAHEKGHKLLTKAKEERTLQATERKKSLLKEKEEEKLRKEKLLKTHLKRDLQQLENQKRQSTLMTKQEVLKELFELAYDKMAAWTVEEEAAFLQQVLSTSPQAVRLTFGEVTGRKFTEKDRIQLHQNFPQLQIEKEQLKDQAGFVLSQGQIDANYLYRDLVASIWEQEGYQMAKMIFQTKES